MFIAHMPFGYMAGRLIQRHLAPERQAAIGWALLGSVFPDFDLLYDNLFDGGRANHHQYLTHLPIFWLSLLPVALLLARRLRRPHWSGAIWLFVLNVFGHMLLDTNVGGIWWLYPLVDHSYALFHHIPGHYAARWMNFVLHWTFLAELAIIAAAMVCLYREHRSKRKAGAAVA